MANSEELLVKVETVKNILVSRATGGPGDDKAYQVLRRELLATSVLRSTLPESLKSCRNLSEFWGFIKLKFGTYQERRDYLREVFSPALDLLEAEGGNPSTDEVTLRLQGASWGYVQESWSKALERKSSDPEGAITAARTLLESVCKHILDETGVDYEEGADLPKLYGLVAHELNLAPSLHTEKIFKQILGGVSAVVEGLGALRNRLSDAHGKGARAVRPGPRHAELAVNLAGSVASFLVSTLEYRAAISARTEGGRG